MGGGKGTRTPNPLLAKQVRYQLRHGPLEIDRISDLLPDCLTLQILLNLKEDYYSSYQGRNCENYFSHNDLSRFPEWA